MSNQRLALLNSFALPEKNHQKSLFDEGQPAIVDLSDLFIDPAGACSSLGYACRHQYSR